MATARFTIEGSQPLLMHNIQLANPANSYAKALKTLNDKKKGKNANKEAISDEIAETEWEGGLYFDRKAGPFLPGPMFRAAMISAARAYRKGKDIERGVYTVSRVNALDYEGPRDLNGLKGADQFWDVQMVRVGNARVPRCRPRFDEWSTEIEVTYNEELISLDTLTEHLRNAGRMEGVGDGRKLAFGRFEITKVNNKIVRN